MDDDNATDQALESMERSIDPSQIDFDVAYKHNMQQYNTQYNISLDSMNIPSSIEMQRYEQILPGFAERALTIVEKGLDHKINQERDALKRESRENFIAQIGSLVIYTSGVIGTLILFALDKSWAGSLFGGGTIVLLIKEFLGFPSKGEKND